MKYNQLGNSGILVSELCMGTMSFGSSGYWSVVGSLGYEDSKRLVDIAIDSGINYFDSADVYSHGQSEDILGKAVKDKRKDVIIATKVRGRMSKEINDVGLSRKHIIESCHNSLKRLGTDYIDHYVLHSYDPITPFEETISTLDDLVSQGKIRYYGVSNFPAWQLMKFINTAEKNHWEKPVSLQAIYSLISRDVEYELIPLCLDQKLAFTPWSPLGGGFLTGKYRNNNFPKGSRMERDFDFWTRYRKPNTEKAIELYYDISEKYGLDMSQMSLKFCEIQDFMTSVIIGATTMEQLKTNIESVNIKLTDDVIKEINNVQTIYPNPCP